MIFRNRIDAGQRLAGLLRPLKDKSVVVIGLPRGGVPVAYEVAKAFHAPLDVIIVRKLSVPWQPELALGAIGEGRQIVLNPEIVSELGISEEELELIETRELANIEQRALRFRKDGKPLDLKDRTVVIVDDGIATGATAQVACRIAKARGAAEVIIATPTAAREAVRKLSVVADRFFVLDTPDNFHSVGQWYLDFSATTEEDVVRILEESKSGSSSYKAHSAQLPS